MSLIDAMSETFVLMSRTRVADGEGGSTVTWTDGAEFTAAVIMDTSKEAQIAQAQKDTVSYTVTFSRDFVLSYHNVIKRKSDGATFRITGPGEKKTPATTALDIKQVSAERWDLT